jgi:hypothetical protein
MTKSKKGILVYVLLLLAALTLRVSIARFLPNEDSDDGRVFTQLGRNLVERGVYSPAAEPPFVPSVVRVPGYPLFLAGVYRSFGFGDNAAVRIVQAVVDTATCALVALLAFYWEPDPDRKRAASIGAFVLAALCPFTAIYVGTILSETLTTFLAVATCLTATLAFRPQRQIKAVQWWSITGLLAGLAVMCRPDSALFAAAIGITLVITIVFAPRRFKERTDGRYEVALRLSRASYLGAIFSLAFCVALVPWTLRNWRSFRIFQPLAPSHAEMPGEFVPRGYLKWLSTWLVDERDVASFIWSIDTLPIEVEEIPDAAFDSEQEKNRVAALLDKYNHPPRLTIEEAESGFRLEGEAEPAEVEPETRTPDSEIRDESAAIGDEELAEGSVAMTPAIDATFGMIARERIARAPFRYYVILPVKRAVGLWFNTHSHYYPFEGDLFGEEGVRHSLSQQIFLPFFTALIWIYTFLALVGCWYLWSSGDFSARRFLLLVVLIIFMRVAYFAFRENPEARYLVELFPFIFVLGGIALVRVIESFANPRRKISHSH